MKVEHMDSKETAKYIGVHVNTLRRYVHDEGLPVLQFPGRRKWVFRKDLVDAWVYQKSQPQVTVNGEVVKNSDAKRNNYGELRVIMP